MSSVINKKCVFGRQKMWPHSVAQSDALLTCDQESRANSMLAGAVR